MVEAVPASYESITILYNHREGAERHAEQIQERLQDTGSVPVNLLQTVEGGSEANAEELGSKIEPGTVLAVRGGEGTYRDVVGALLLDGMEELNSQVAVTSLNQRGKTNKKGKEEEAASNACDIGKSLHGRLTDPALMFGGNLQAVTAYALESVITTATGKQTKANAMSYIGFGKSATASETINTEEYKARNSLSRDLGIAAHTLLDPSSFMIVDERNEEHTLGELLFNKGEWMAKYAHFDIRHWDKAFRATKVAPGRLMATYTAGRLLIGNAKGENRERPLHFQTRSSVQVHHDGERPVNVLSWSDVHIGLHPRSYTVLTTKL